MHRAPRIDPAERSSDDGLGRLRLPAHQSEGHHGRALEPPGGLPALVQHAAQHRDRRNPRRLPGRRAAARGERRCCRRRRAARPIGSGNDAAKVVLADDAAGCDERASPIRLPRRRPDRPHAHDPLHASTAARFAAHPGDTLASALLANGEHLVARSFKYHRPRGILSAGAEEPAALVEIGGDPGRTDPNVRVTEQEVYEGLEARPQNCWPSLRFDLGRGERPGRRRSSRPASTTRPSRAGRAGCGSSRSSAAPPAWAARRGRPTPTATRSTNRHCDVLVVGGGPAGLMAALAAGRAGARVDPRGGDARARRHAALARSGHAVASTAGRRRDWIAAMRAGARRRCRK